MRIGVGIQNKVLEAMVMGVPVVATSLAVRALDQNAAASGLRIASDAASFAQHCAELLQSDDEARQAGQAGRRYVQNFHRWETAADSFVAQYRKVL
jgi:glycosyltransferase involved in cell wall biosynthesis